MFWNRKPSGSARAWGGEVGGPPDDGRGRLWTMLSDEKVGFYSHCSRNPLKYFKEASDIA